MMLTCSKIDVNVEALTIEIGDEKVLLNVLEAT